MFIWAQQKPLFRKLLWRFWYNYWSRRFGNRDGWDFMNYGYSPTDPNEAPPELQPEDEPFRQCIQLYYQLASRVDLEGKEVVEVGSGRGGGSAFVHRHFRPAKMLGIDLASSCVDYSRQTHDAPGLSFQVGAADNLPQADDSADVVLNVESSHAYPSRERFFREVSRVLRSGGHFLLTDFFKVDELDAVEALLGDAGFAFQEKTKINAQVLKALAENEAAKKEMFANFLDSGSSNMFHEFGGFEGSAVVEALRSEYLVYQRYVLRKR